MTHDDRVLALLSDAVRQRFLGKIEQIANGCWDWKAYRDPAGYGRLQLGRVTVGGHRSPDFAHRVSYELFIGPIPVGREIDHLCRNRGCVNPAHLEAVTRRENQRRGNSPSGINARKTHCKRGHPFDTEHTFVRPSGHRRCRICERVRRAGKNCQIAGALNEGGRLKASPGVPMEAALVELAAGQYALNLEAAA